MRILEGQLRFDSLEIKPERQDCIGLDMYRVEMLGIMGEGCWQEKKKKN